MKPILHEGWPKRACDVGILMQVRQQGSQTCPDPRRSMGAALHDCLTLFYSTAPPPPSNELSPSPDPVHSPRAMAGASGGAAAQVLRARPRGRRAKGNGRHGVEETKVAPPQSIAGRARGGTARRAVGGWDIGGPMAKMALASVPAGASVVWLGARCGPAAFLFCAR